MAKKPKHPLDQARERVREHLPVEPPPKKKEKSDNGDIVSRRDERGIPYPGDFPNPASDRIRGCF